jgi:hypothetical protein
MVDNYKDLEIWQLALEQCVGIYRLTKDFPKDELYGLVSHRLDYILKDNLNKWIEKNSLLGKKLTKLYNTIR